MDLLIGGEDFLREADQFSQEALHVCPSNPLFQGTRGSLLIERGDADKGLPLVRCAMEFNTDPRLKAVNACYLALGEIQKGNRQESQRLLELARGLDLDCCLLGKVELSLRVEG